MAFEQTIPRVYEVREMQDKTKLAESTIRHGLSEGRWTFYKVGRRTLIDADEVDRMFQLGKHPAVAVTTE